MTTEWRQVRYMLFELPDAPGTFSERIEGMQGLVAKAADSLAAGHRTIPCAGSG
jgi:hypothetical protein